MSEKSKNTPTAEPQAVSSAVLKAIREANMQLVRTGDDAFMLVPYKLATAEQAAPKTAPGEPVHGDVLPPVGSRVYIRHGRDNGAHACTVTGYYAWGDLGGDKRLHRVFVRLVYEGTDTQQARMLCDCHPTAEAALSEAAPQQEAQEPAFWMNEKGHTWSHSDWKQFPKHRAKYPIPLYPHFPAPQPAPAPLSDEVAKDAALWHMAVLIGNELMMHPEKRTHATAVKAYMDATHSGSDLTGAVDAAIAAQGGKT